MKKLLNQLLLPTIILCISISGLTAQQSTGFDPSLLNLSYGALDDTLWNNKKSNYQKALEYSRAGLQKALNENNYQWISTFHSRLGLIHRYMGSHRVAIQEFEKSLEVADKFLNDPSQDPQRMLYCKGRAQHELATTYEEIEENSKAVDYADEAFQTYQQLDMPDQQVKVLLQRISILGDSKKLPEALVDYQRVEDLLSKGEISDSLKDKASLNSRIGIAHAQNKLYKNALKYFRRQEEIISNSEGLAYMWPNLYVNIGNCYFNLNDIDSSIYYYQKALNEEEQLKGNTILNKANLFSNYGMALFRKEKLKEAEQQLNKALEVRKGAASPDIEGSQELYYNKALLAIALKDLSKAQAICDSLVSIANKKRDKLEFQIDAKEIQYDIFLAKGQYRKALAVNEGLKPLKASLSQTRNQSNDRAILVQEAYLQARKEEAITQLQLKHHLIEKGLGLAILILFVLVAIAFYQSMLNRSKIQLAAKDAMLAGDTKARNDVSDQLHDDINGLLTGVNLHLDRLINYIREEEQEKLETHKAQGMLQKAMKGVRGISHNLNDNFPVSYGLKTSLESYLDDLGSDASAFPRFFKDIDIEELSFSENESKTLFRIVQPLVANAIKHAQAREIAVHLYPFKENGKDLLKIMVEDDGIGFKEGETKANTGIGMENIKLRVKQMNGSISIDSRPGAGSSIQIDIPLSNSNFS